MGAEITSPGGGGVAQSLLEWAAQGALDNIDPGTGNFTVPISAMITGYSITLVETDIYGWRSGDTLTVPAGKAGWYQISFGIDHPTDEIGGSANEALADYNVGLRLNSRVEKYSADSNSSLPETGGFSVPIYLNVGDTIEFIINADTSHTNEDFLLRASIISLDVQIFTTPTATERFNGEYERTDGAGVGTGQWYVPTYGDGYEYIYADDGPDGKEFISFFTTALPSRLTSGNNVSQLIGYRIQADNGSIRYVSLGWSSNGTDELNISFGGLSGNNNLSLAAAGAFSGNIINGSVRYTR